MYVIKQTTTGRYFITGRGMATSNPNEATKFTTVSSASNQIGCLNSAGLFYLTVEAVPVVDPNIVQNRDGSSYAVSFVRPSQLRSDGSVNAHKLNPSKRRFATYEEAVHHGSRFMVIEKHAGFYVTKRYEPVNSYVNKVTGKTNPEQGKARTNR